MPTRLGRYQLDARLGAGGMAEVYRARVEGPLGFALPVAIKWMRPELSTRPELVDMFVTEARISARLRHPNIVAVTDFDRDERGRLYLVMELVEGKDLAALAATGALPAPVALHIVACLARGLGFAHQLPAAADGIRGVVHRDVSPHNALLSWQGAVKVSDFGIAKLRAATLASGTLRVSGKPAYMSPEQARGEPLDGRSDLFALGAILWELLAGRPLFGRGDTREVLARVLYAPVPDLRRERPDVPDDVAALARALLARPVAERPASAAALLAALTACRAWPADGEGALAALLAERFPAEAPRRAADAAPPAPAFDPTERRRLQEAATLTAPRGPAARPRRLGVAVLLAVLAALAAVLAAGAVALAC